MAKKTPQVRRVVRRRLHAELNDALDGIEQNKTGRKPIYRPSYASLAYDLALLGATNADLAKRFKVNPKTLDEWISGQPRFRGALNEGRDEADARVADALFHRALGYSHKDTYIAQYQGRIITKEIIKHYPPDTAAAIFWLKNRQFEKWRDRVEYVPPVGDAAKALRDQLAQMDAATKGNPAKGKGAKS